MKLLLASGGVTNASIRSALIELLGKPISESTALFIPTAVYAIPGAAQNIRKKIGTAGDEFCDLGWKSWGVLELTTLSTLKKEMWLPLLDKADALLVGGGDCQYLYGCMTQSGFTELLPSLLEKTVWVGQSAGSMIMTSFGTTYGHHTLPPETPKCFGILDFAILPHLDHEMFPNNSLANLEKMAAKIPLSTYIIDDQTALKVTGSGVVEVITEGHWKYLDKKQKQF